MAKDAGNPWSVDAVRAVSRGKIAARPNRSKDQRPVGWAERGWRNRMQRRRAGPLNWARPVRYCARRYFFVVSAGAGVGSGTGAGAGTASPF
jgi:hypothetical protein